MNFHHQDASPLVVFLVCFFGCLCNNSTYLSYFDSVFCFFWFPLWFLPILQLAIPSLLCTSSHEPAPVPWRRAANRAILRSGPPQADRTGHIELTDTYFNKTTLLTTLFVCTSYTKQVSQVSGLATGWWAQQKQFITGPGTRCVFW